MRVLCNLLLAVFLMAGSLPSFAGDNPCDDATSVSKERVEIDIQLRSKRADLAKEQLKLREDMINNDLETVQVSKKLLATFDGDQKEKQDALWKKMEELGEQRRLASNKLQDLWPQMQALSDERMIKRLELRTKILEKKYECLLNNELTQKLGDLIKESKQKGKLVPVQQSELESLYAHRMELVAVIKAEFDAYAKKLSAIKEKFYKSVKDYADVLAKENEYDISIDSSSDAVYNEADTMSNKLNEWKNQLSNMSERMYTLLKK
jgi:hypothetical protein